MNLGYDKDELASLMSGFERRAVPHVVDWLNCSSVIYSLVEEIGQGAGRIAEIVKALKAYTYLDQAPVQIVDMHEGLDNTLVILAQQAEARGDRAAPVRRPTCPRIEAYGSELNQVWTNIIDNAIDAMDGKGEITLRTRHDDALGHRRDRGQRAGHPGSDSAQHLRPVLHHQAARPGHRAGPEYLPHIIVQKHKGRIDVFSQPGKTRFEVRIPLHLRRNETWIRLEIAAWRPIEADVREQRSWQNQIIWPWMTIGQC